MASAFNGIYNAFDFAYGLAGAASGALQVTQGSNTAGTYTIICAAANLASAGGQPIILNTNTPISIGGDSSQETVTPTAVSKDAFGNWLITATFAFAHSTGDTVSSGTAGLAEAMNYAATQGGGLVAFTNQCVRSLALAQTRTAVNAFIITVKSASALVHVLDYSGYTGATSYTAAVGVVLAPTAIVLY